MKYTNEQKAEAQYIAKVITGTYNWQGVREIEGTPNLYPLIKKALCKNTEAIEEWYVGEMKATYRMASTGTGCQIWHYPPQDGIEDQITK